MTVVQEKRILCTAAMQAPNSCIFHNSLFFNKYIKSDLKIHLLWTRAGQCWPEGLLKSAWLK
jgi:hypothetical protein